MHGETRQNSQNSRYDYETKKCMRMLRAELISMNRGGENSSRTGKLIPRSFPSMWLLSVTIPDTRPVEQKLTNPSWQGFVKWILTFSFSNILKFFKKISNELNRCPLKSLDLKNSSSLKQSLTLSFYKKLRLPMRVWKQQREIDLSCIKKLITSLESQWVKNLSSNCLMRNKQNITNIFVPGGL